ncbi:MAG: hypothetical protein J6Y33_03445 [Prevotella sp.]|nr:hypothetical protein [Prevotella sp.]
MDLHSTVRYIRRRLPFLFRGGGEDGRRPLRIEGVPDAPVTPEPDDAELAAQALLESLSGIMHGKPSPEAQEGTAAYYRQLAGKIRLAHEASRLRAARFLAYCEQELLKDSLPVEGKGSLALLEAELFKRIDTVEREGGELKRRWQRCLAEVTVRMMRGVSTTRQKSEGRA